MSRPTMSALIARLTLLVNNDQALTDDQLQALLDDHAVDVDAPLIPRVPFYTRHDAPYENLEDGCLVYVGYNTVLTTSNPAQYTIDLQRGIVTTPAAEYRGLWLQATAYDLNAAAADGWELIAGRYSANFDFSAHRRESFSRSQQYTQALQQATRYRAQAWPTSTSVDRADTPANRGSIGQQMAAGLDRAIRLGS